MSNKSLLILCFLNFTGIPFLFWEQYMNLRPCLYKAMGLATAAAFVLVALLLFNVWAAILVIFSIAGTLLQLAGATFALGIKLSAIPAVILIASIGMNVCFTVHVSLVSSN